MPGYPLKSEDHEPFVKLALSSGTAIRPGELILLMRRMVRELHKMHLDHMDTEHLEDLAITADILRTAAVRKLTEKHYGGH